MQFKILDTEIIDNTVQDENGNVQPSEISVLVLAKINGVEYYLDYQTTTTYDYGAYSPVLAPYDGTDDYTKIIDLFDGGVDNVNFYNLLDDIEKVAGAQNIWLAYTDTKYIRNKGHYGAMDANSEVNIATKK